MERFPITAPSITIAPIGILFLACDDLHCTSPHQCSKAHANCIGVPAISNTAEFVDQSTPNLSNAALSDGLEWTTKVSQHELPHLWTKVKSTFESYWYDDEFKQCTSANVGEFRSAIQHERESTADDAVEMISFDLRPFPYQQEILDVIEAEREIQKKFRHLVVAATGTGKTMIAAFDYRRFALESGGLPKLLFVAHREEILQQALQSYRAVLRDHNFGELLVGKHKATNLDHLFCSIQSFDSRDLHHLGEKQMGLRSRR